MRMTEVVSFLDLSVYPSVALVFFLFAFIAVLWKALSTPRAQTEREASIVLDDDHVVEPRISIQNSGMNPSSHDSNAHEGATHG